MDAVWGLYSIKRGDVWKRSGAFLGGRGEGGKGRSGAFRQYEFGAHPNMFFVFLNRILRLFEKFCPEFFFTVLKPRYVCDFAKYPEKIRGEYFFFVLPSSSVVCIFPQK